MLPLDTPTTTRRQYDANKVVERLDLVEHAANLAGVVDLVVVTLFALLTARAS